MRFCSINNYDLYSELAIIGIAYLEKIFSKYTSILIKESFLNAISGAKSSFPGESIFPYIAKLKGFDNDITRFIVNLAKNPNDSSQVSETARNSKDAIWMIAILMAGIIEAVYGDVNWKRISILEENHWNALAKGLGCSIIIFEKKKKGIINESYGEDSLFTKPIKIRRYSDD